MKYDLADILSIKNGRPPGVMVVQPSPTDQVELLLDQYNVTAKRLDRTLNTFMPLLIVRSIQGSGKLAD